MTDHKETKITVTPANSPVSETVGRQTGRVKWFNSRAGYGFVTVVSGCQNLVSNDVFVHHSAIQVEQEQYKYLVQGEYVDFTCTKSESKKHEYQAEDVRGVKNGKLICETRNEVRANHPTDMQNTSDATNRPLRVRGGGPREGPREGEEWMLVRRKNKKTVPRHGNNNTNRRNDD